MSDLTQCFVEMCSAGSDRRVFVARGTHGPGILSAVPKERRGSQSGLSPQRRASVERDPYDTPGGYAENSIPNEAFIPEFAPEEEPDTWFPFEWQGFGPKEGSPQGSNKAQPAVGRSMTDGLFSGFLGLDKTPESRKAERRPVRLPACVLRSWI